VLLGPIAWNSSVITAGETQSLAMGNVGPNAATMGFGGSAGFGAGGASAARGGSAASSGSGSGARGGFGGFDDFGSRPADGGAGGGMWTSNGTLTAAQRDLLDYAQEHRDGARYVLTVSNVLSATPYILDAGADVLPVGGFSGQVPFPTLTQFEQYVASGQVRYVYLTAFGGPGGPAGQTSQTAASQIEAWIPAHCSKVPASDYGGTPVSSSSGDLYECTGS
jgi:hypothetical protein